MRMEWRRENVEIRDWVLFGVEVGRFVDGFKELLGLRFVVYRCCAKSIHLLILFVLSLSLLSR